MDRPDLVALSIVINAPEHNALAEAQELLGLVAPLGSLALTTRSLLRLVLLGGLSRFASSHFENDKIIQMGNGAKSDRVWSTKKNTPPVLAKTGTTTKEKRRNVWRRPQGKRNKKNIE